MAVMVVVVEVVLEVVVVRVFQGIAKQYCHVGSSPSIPFFSGFI